MAGFVQIIEFRTSRYDEVRALGEEFRRQRMETADRAPVGRIAMCADRDRPDTYLNIVEFPSYDDAMANSEHPATMDFARRMAELCDEPPRFYNLDLSDLWMAIPEQQQQQQAAPGSVRT